MKQRGMKILSLLLSFVLVLSLVPAASADVTITAEDIYDLMGKMNNLANEKIDAEDFAAVIELQGAMDDLDGACYQANDEVTPEVVAAYNNAMNVYLKYTATVPVTGVSLTPTSATLSVGATETLTATVEPSNATDKSVSWSSDNTAVATVENGVVTAQGAGTATITVTTTDGNKQATCAVTVNKADPTAPTGLTATYGQKLANVTLPDGWTWADSTQSVGSVVSPAATFKANFAGDDNYNAASNVDVTVTVSKADATTAMQAASVSIAGTSGKTATVSYALPDGASYGTVTNSNTEFFTVDTTNGLVLTAAKSWTASDWATDTSKTFTVAVSGATNYNDYTLTVTVTPTYKATQTITASDVTATYGDTDAKIEATTTSGGGTLSYTVKSGDAVTVDASGNLTIVKAGSAVITVTAAETDTYAQATKDVNVTVNTKAMTVSAEDVNVTVDGQAHGITVTVTDPASGATVKYGTEAGSYTLDASPTQTEVGEKTVYYQVTADNYTTYTGSAKVTVSAKQTQTITAENVTAAYGDTGKSIEASTSGDGTLSYAVKSGDAVTVNETTGALTIVKAGSAVITVTASETATYTQATKDVTVTINKANAIAATVKANNRTYDGTAQPLVTVEGEPTGGEMQYALGTEIEVTQPYTTSIPTGTNAGTYYVWYKVKGDDNHTDSSPACVPVTVHMLTVTFEVNGGSAVEAQSVAKGEKVTRPADPSKSGNAFDGWYQDATLSVPYDFAQPLTADVTLYAKWTPNDYTLTTITGTSTDSHHTWTKNSNVTVVITAKLATEPDNSFAHFIGVQLDGTTLTPETDYTAKEGSTVVTLKPATLQRLSVGAHTVTILYDNGSVNTRLTVLRPSNTPRTGDESNAALWLTVLAVSALGMAALTLGGKKRRTAKR